MGDVLNFPGYDPNFSDVYEEEMEPNLSIDLLIDGMKNNNVVEAFVIGYTENGDFYVASNNPSKANFIYNLEKTKVWLLTNVVSQQ